MTSSLRAKDRYELAAIELTRAVMHRRADGGLEDVEVLAIGAAMLEPPRLEAETRAEREELARAVVSVEIAQEMRARARRQTVTARPILRAIEEDHARRRACASS